MSVDGTKKANTTDSRVMSEEIGKNQPGSPKSVEHARRVKEAEGQKTHAAHPKEPDASLAGNTISEKHYPTNPLGD